MIGRLAELIRGLERQSAGYSRALQAARVRASYQRAYFAPALFNLVPVRTDLIASMAVDAQWRLYYNEAWLTAHTVEENAAVLIHEVSHLLRDHAARKQAAAVRDIALWNTATDCEINDDLTTEGLPLPDDPPRPGNYGSRPARTPRRTTESC
jgi:predicted metal-dependent peptidase